jgi:23S rRNA (cytosine1962-C5)-methyltransferase
MQAMLRYRDPMAEKAPSDTGVGEGETGSALAGRLRKRTRHLDRWARRAHITAYRLFDRDIPGYHFAVDRYAGWLWVSEYPWSEDDRLHATRRAELITLLPAITGVPSERIVVSTHQRQRWGETQYVRRDHGGETLQVQEGDLRFEVNLGAHLDTGLFLDHRGTRARVRAEARGKRFLNLFAYTGSFTVYAAAGSASSSVSVDLSKTYLDWARRNLAINRLDGPAHRLLRQDVLDFLNAAVTSGERFDLVVCDPPPRSSAKSGVFEIQRDQDNLLRMLRTVLAPGGRLYFSSNLRGFVLDESPLQGMTVREITPGSLPPDFHGTLPHRCWVIGG